MSNKIVSSILATTLGLGVVNYASGAVIPNIIEYRSSSENSTMADSIEYTESISGSNDVLMSSDDNHGIESINMSVPSGNTDWYTFMDANCITDVSSEQWEMKQNYWLEANGIWCSCNDYVVAMGSYYGTLGDRFKITTDRGNVYTVVIGDIKSDCDTDVSHQYTPGGYNYVQKNVIEFLVDTQSLPYNVYNSGNVGEVYYIAGNIVSIEKLNS